MTDALLLVASSSNISSSSSSSSSKVNVQNRKAGFLNSAGISLSLTIKPRDMSLKISFFYCIVLITAV